MRKIIFSLVIAAIAIFLIQCKKDHKGSQAAEVRVMSALPKAKTMGDIFFAGNPDFTDRHFQKSTDGLILRTVTRIKSDVPNKVFRYEIIDEDLQSKPIKKGYLASRRAITPNEDLFKFDFENGGVAYDPPSTDPKLLQKKRSLILN